MSTAQGRPPGSLRDLVVADYTVCHVLGLFGLFGLFVIVGNIARCVKFSIRALYGKVDILRNAIIFATMSSSTRSSRFPRFARSSNVLYGKGKHHFLSKEHGVSYEWEIGMILYYIRKVHILGSRESIVDMFEYLMTVPAFMASKREVRDVVIAKISELDFPGDREWGHLRMTILGFMDDLIYHPCYRP